MTQLVDEQPSSLLQAADESLQDETVGRLSTKASEPVEIFHWNVSLWKHTGICARLTQGPIGGFQQPLGTCSLEFLPDSVKRQILRQSLRITYP